MVRTIASRLDDFRAQRRVQAGSLIITAFGDAIVPRGGRIWLGSLIQLLEPLALNERLVRTSVFRLVQEGWLHAQAVGRRSDYGLTEAGQRRFDEASRQIYAAHAPQWDHRWRFIINVGELSARPRDALKRTLFWHGFGTLASDCFVHPSADLSLIFESLRADGLADLIPSLRPLLASDHPLNGAATDTDMVRQAWNLASLAEHYQQFTELYAPLLDTLSSEPPPSEQDCFLLRLLLIHDYRRLLLRDPELPEELLPTRWPGHAARAVCRDLYRALRTRSDHHLDQTVSLADGTQPVWDAATANRFG